MLVDVPEKEELIHRRSSNPNAKCWLNHCCPLERSNMPQGFEFGLASLNISVYYLDKDNENVLIIFSSIIELGRRARMLNNQIRIPKGLPQAEMIGQNPWPENEKEARGIKPCPGWRGLAQCQLMQASSKWTTNLVWVSSSPALPERQCKQSVCTVKNTVLRTRTISIWWTPRSENVDSRSDWQIPLWPYTYLLTPRLYSSPFITLPWASNSIKKKKKGIYFILFLCVQIIFIEEKNICQVVC